MNGVIFRLTRRYIKRRAFQSILFVLGVALGVAVGVAIDLANTSASRAFDLSVNTVTGRTTHQIIGSSGSLPTSLYTQIRTDLGLQTSAPIIDAAVQAISLDNRSLRLLGVDPFAESLFRDYLTPEVNTAEFQLGLYAFATQPNTVLISASLAESFNLQTGDTLTLRTPNASGARVTIVGLLYASDDLNETAINNLLLADIATAQELAGEPGQISRIDLILPDDYDLAALEAILPPGAVMTTPAANQDALNQMTDAFELNLQALSLLALLVGVFLIYNTVTFSVVQRRPVIGILRSLGTTRRQIFSLILAEAFFLGALGTILGLGLGIMLGQGAVGLVSQTINDLYFRVNVDRVTVSGATLLKGAIIGISASLLAAIVPSWEATRTPPAGVMRRSSVEQGTRRLLPFITFGALLLVIGGMLTLQVPTISLIVSFAALFMILIGCALLTPLALVIMMRAMTPLTHRLFGVLGRMAPRAVTRSLSRTSIAVAALTLAVSVIVGVSVMISSFRTTVQNWLDITLGADIFISPFDNDSGGLDVAINPTITSELAELDGVREVATVRSTTVITPDYPDLPPANLVAPNMDITNGERRFDWLESSSESFWAALEAEKIIVSEPFAFRRDITPTNNTITLLTDRGPRTFTIIGVYYDYTSDQGSLLMHQDVYREYFDDPYISAIGLILDRDTNLDAVLDRLQRDTLVGTGLEAQSNRDLRAGVIEVFDRTFAITVALRVLATVVAFIGILSALMSLQLEHTRQYGIMRANGMTPRQLRSFTFIQTGLMGTTAGLLAAPIGLVLALVLIEVINVRSFGWTMELTLSPQEFIQAFLVALIAALVAGLYPAWRLGRLVAAEALRSE